MGNTFGEGSLLDIHLDIDVNPEEINKRIANAASWTKKMGGKLAGGLEKELDDLTAPKLTWQDFVRFTTQRKRVESAKSNWNSPKRKQLFSGLFVPQKISNAVSFGVFFDTSGSMSPQQISYGLSQVSVLDEGGEGWLCPFDAGPYYDSAVRIKNAKRESLAQAKYVGGGGTVLLPALSTYEKEMGEVDLLIIISDLYLADTFEVMKWVAPGRTQVVWLSTNGNPGFKPACGRIFQLMNE